MLVWRANLKRDASLIGRGGGSSGGDPLAMELLFRGAYTEALRWGCGGSSTCRQFAPCILRIGSSRALATLGAVAACSRAPCTCPGANRLIRRCGSKSLAYWAGQQAGHGPSEASKLRLHQAAVEVRVRQAAGQIGCSKRRVPAVRNACALAGAEGAERAAGTSAEFQRVP